MLVAVFVLTLALSVSAQYGQQTPAPSACPQGMTVAPAYGTTCYNGGFYFNGVCCEVPTSTTAAPSACPQGMIATPAYGTTCYNGGFYYKGVCCSVACPNGQAGTSPVGGMCPTGTSLQNGLCCTGGNTSNLVGVCEVPEQAFGSCINGGCSTPGYACDAAGANCCPIAGLDYRNSGCQLGPTIAKLCPVGYVSVFIPESNPSDMCVDLQCVPGICDESVQSSPCTDGQCQSGFTCYTPADICCPTV